MLGPSLLVAPVFREDNVAEYYLPRGKWTHLLTGQVVEGGAWRRETVDFTQVPLFVRENTILPINPNEDEPAWKLADPLTLNLFQIGEGADVSLRVPASDGPGRARFRCQRTGDRLTVTGDGAAKHVSLLLRSWRAVARVTNGKVVRELPEGLLVEWTDTAKPVTVLLA
jgi:alpha-D-xyloside xylohydrolase